MAGGNDGSEQGYFAVKMAPKQERRLLRAIRTGSQDACAELVRSHYASIYRFLLRLSGQVSSAEDLTQETFAAAWAGIGKFGGRASLGTWLHKIAYGKFVDFARRAKRGEAAAEQLRNRKDLARGVPNPLEQVIAKERSGRVYAAVQELDGDGRDVIVLHYFQGLSFREMAVVLDEPVGTVKWRTSRALGQLKQSLDGRV